MQKVEWLIGLALKDPEDGLKTPRERKQVSQPVITTDPQIAESSSSGENGCLEAGLFRTRQQNGPPKILPSAGSTPTTARYFPTQSYPS